MGFDTVTSSTDRDNLFAGTYPIVKGAVTVADGQTLTRGAVLGIVTASGEALLLDTAAVDGSENFYAILLEDVTTSGATQVAPVALSGEFQTQALSFGGATTYADVIDDARDKNCYFLSGDADDNINGG